MISKATWEKIGKCHGEIGASEKLLTENGKLVIANAEREIKSQNEEQLSSVFRSAQCWQLSVPSGDNSHRLYDLSFALAKPVIEAHIANKRAELAELNAIAELEVTASGV